MVSASQPFLRAGMPAPLQRTSPMTRGRPRVLPRVKLSQEALRGSRAGWTPCFFTFTSFEKVFLCAGGTGSRMQGKTSYAEVSEVSFMARVHIFHLFFLLFLSNETCKMLLLLSHHISRDLFIKTFPSLHTAVLKISVLTRYRSHPKNTYSFLGAKAYQFGCHPCALHITPIHSGTDILITAAFPHNASNPGNWTLLGCP